MKCEDVWPALETGGWWRRWRAKVHARRCVSCADAAKWLEDFRRQMTAPEPLSSKLRERWLSATESFAVLPRRRALNGMRIAIGATAVAASMGLAVALWPERAVRPPSPPAPDARMAATVEVSAVQVRSLDVSEELDRLLNELSRSEAEIGELAEHIRLRQASDQLEMLLAKYERK